ncbi:MAG: LicD family protein [Bacteroidaceae bacterium]|nr:LicD family protein [Bacteroidaceae bacterium]
MQASYNIRDLQLRLAEMLKEIDAIFAANNLTYYLWAGTLIGAVRHKGFIPWDDDLDIAMPRRDYNLFIERAKEILPAYFEFISMETDDRHQFPFGKIQDTRTTLIERRHMGYLGGIYIDVFPLDSVPENKFRQEWRLAKYEFYKRLLYFVVRDPYKHGHGPSSWLPLIVRKFFTLPYLQRKLKSIATSQQSIVNSQFVADYDYGHRGIIPAQWIGMPQTVEFEGIMAKTVEHPDPLLTQIYGDYMTLPPEDKRKQHLFYYLDLDKPFASFQY